MQQKKKNTTSFPLCHMFWCSYMNCLTTFGFWFCGIKIFVVEYMFDLYRVKSLEALIHRSLLGNML